MTQDPVRCAADKLADVVSMYLEGRADMDELREATADYYRAHEDRLFSSEVESTINSDPNAAIKAHYEMHKAAPSISVMVGNEVSFRFANSLHLPKDCVVKGALCVTITGEEMVFAGKVVECAS